MPADIYQCRLTDVPTDRFRIGIGRRDPGPALEAFDSNELYLIRRAKETILNAGIEYYV